MVAGLMSACGGNSAGGSGSAGEGSVSGESSAAADAGDSGEKVVINYYDWDASAADVVDRFNASQDKIEVVFTQIP